MRVLQVINSLEPGGAEKLVQESIPFYLEHDVQVTLLLFNGTDSPFLQRLKEQCPNLKIVSLGKGSVYNPRYIFKLVKHLKQTDLAHVHLFPSLYWAAAARMISSSRCKMVFTEHNHYNRRRKNWFFKPWDRLFYGKYDTIIGVSDLVEDVLKKYLGRKDGRIRVIENGVPIEQIEQATPYDKEKLGMSPDDKMILQVSSFTAQKDQSTVIRAVAGMNIPVQLYFVGVGPTQETHKDLSIELGIGNNVHFLNTRKDVIRLMKTADVVVLSTKFEGLSLTSIEAMASGTPFVASRVPGVDQLVEGAGLLFDLDDSEDLANTLSRLLTNNELARQVAESGKQRAAQYHIKRTVEKHIALYRELCPNQS